MEKPKCPYCGGEMRYAFNGDTVGTHFFICETCLSRTPAVSFNDDPYAAADVKPVVLCKDCKYAAEGDKICLIWFRQGDPDFYCANGERREENK